MSWVNNYRQASFRNVPFFVENSETTSGRRVVIHEFPKQDNPFPEDMGKQAEKFTLSGYVLGDDYFAQRDALQEALEKKGPGKLVHPYRGTMDVVCLTYRISETVSDGRMAHVTMEFCQAEELGRVVETVNTVRQTQLIKADSYQRVREFFDETYSIAIVPSSEVQKALSSVTEALSLIDDARRTVGAIAQFQRDLITEKAKRLR